MQTHAPLTPKAFPSHDKDEILAQIAKLGSIGKGSDNMKLPNWWPNVMFRFPKGPDGKSDGITLDYTDSSKTEAILCHITGGGDLWAVSTNTQKEILSRLAGDKSPPIEFEVSTWAAGALLSEAIGLYPRDWPASGHLSHLVRDDFDRVLELAPALVKVCENLGMPMPEYFAALTLKEAKEVHLVGNVSSRHSPPTWHRKDNYTPEKKQKWEDFMRDHKRQQGSIYTRQEELNNEKKLMEKRHEEFVKEMRDEKDSFMEAQITEAMMGLKR